MSKLNSIEVWCDASIEKNKSVSAFLIKDSDNNILEQSVIANNETFTSNMGEFCAVLEAVKSLIELKLVDKPITIYTDSKLVVEQLNNNFVCRSPKLIPFRDEIWKLTELFNSYVTFKWIPREQNQEADSLSRTLYEHL